MPEDQTETGTASTEADKFEALTKRLLKVPKEELDEARERDRLAKG